MRVVLEASESCHLKLEMLAWGRKGWEVGKTTFSFITQRERERDRERGRDVPQ
jgi:hypothetical protein